MIILDDVEAAQLKAPTTATPQPDHESDGGHVQRQAEPSTAPTTPTPPPHKIRLPRRRLRLIVAASLTLCALTWTIFHSVLSRHPLGRILFEEALGMRPPPPPPPEPLLIPYTLAACSRFATWLPADEDTSGPASWGPYQAATTSFTIPSMANIFAVSDGILNGVFTTQTSDTDDPSIRVDIVAQYYDKVAFESTHLCLIHDTKHDAAGVGLFAERLARGRVEPEHWNEKDDLLFRATLILPRTLSNHNLRTQLPKWHHNLDVLTPFNEVSLASRKGIIHATNLTTSVLDIETTDAIVSGAFSAHTASFRVTDSPLRADISMTGASGPTNLTIHAIRSRVESHIDLHSSLEASSISINSRHGSVNLTILNIDPHSTFDINVDPHKSVAHVSVPNNIRWNNVTVGYGEKWTVQLPAEGTSMIEEEGSIDTTLASGMPT
ncbi:hypothetical protein CYLTODRAFT_488636 [Cylindrobasidium torrendii FP15055 ss-10]|uniref:Uncharacterized protein n=1 Tax=Cylindrobasidium torrendii FP15055 ss-10 TaxID=1314674 RepID=A0A0D7BHW6_9AGAR|nr:hypothetical protein CYLTODRAFT_488636 [Cylindrobasidium torrendii FP15055 ss-10]